MYCDRSSPPLHPALARQHTPEAAPPSDEVVPLHWLSTAAAFAGTGGLASADELAGLIRQRCEETVGQPESEPASLVARWIASRAVVSLRSPWGDMFPLFQFDLPTASVVDAMAPLQDELRPVFDDLELALWFVTPNDWLGGARPAFAMHHSLPAVLQAARADRFVAGGP